jgi:3',5'-cyclic AMP phosphodiesterase CpdA
MSKLQGMVPWGILPGNHDTNVVSNNRSGFSSYDTYFPKSLFSNMSWYKEGFRNNQNSFVSIDVLGIKLGLVSLSIEPDDEVLKWASGVVEKNKDHLFILATHKYLVDEGGQRDEGLDFSINGNDGEMLWQKFVKKNCEVRLVLSGHFHKTDGEDMRIDKNDCEKDVTQTIQDYQAREKGGNGRLRVYTFTPKAKSVEVKTYSPYTDTFETDEDSEFGFEF